MEGIALILIGAALFSHSWFLMGLYLEARSFGIVMLAIAIGLLFTLTFDTQVLGTQGSDLDKLRDVNILRALVVVWAVYAAAVAAQGYWEMENYTVQAIGYFSLIVAVVSLGAVFYFLSVVADFYDADVTLLFSLAGFVLALMAAVLFLYLAVPAMRGLQSAIHWILLGGSILVTLVGLLFTTTIIVA